MKFLGQPSIMKQLGIYLPQLYAEKTGMNFLVTGPSGYGKTLLVLSCCNYLANKGRFQYTSPSPEKGLVKFDLTSWVNFIDEVHELKSPEFLYPILDKKEHVIFLATNESGLLKEPLVNRCIPLIFEEYSKEDLLLILREAYKYPVSEEFLLEIIKAGNNNPRLIISLAQRLNMVTKQIGIPSNIKVTLEEIFGIRDGLDLASQRYLEILEKLGGRASLYTLNSVLHINKSAILYQIEPVLLYTGKIQITSKGRILV